MYTRIATILAVSSVVLFGSPAHAQETTGSEACTASLHYMNGEMIDPRNLRVGATITDGTFTVPVYPGMTPESICEFLDPMRVQVAEALRRAEHAELLRAEAVNQGASDRTFRTRIEESLFFRDPPLTIFLFVILAWIMKKLFFFVVRLFFVRRRTFKEQRSSGTLSGPCSVPNRSSFLGP